MSVVISKLQALKTLLPSKHCPSFSYTPVPALYIVYNISGSHYEWPSPTPLKATWICAASLN